MSAGAVQRRKSQRKNLKSQCFLASQLVLEKVTAYLPQADFTGHAHRVAVSFLAVAATEMTIRIGYAVQIVGKLVSAMRKEQGS